MRIVSVRLATPRPHGSARPGTPPHGSACLQAPRPRIRVRPGTPPPHGSACLQAPRPHSSARPGTPPPHAGIFRHDAVPDLWLRVRSAGRHYHLLAHVGRPTPAADGPPYDTDDADGTDDTDEHVAAEVAPGSRWPAVCADVLHDRHPRAFADAARRLDDIAAAHPGCRLVAAPLAAGGWAVAGGRSRTVVPLAHRVRPDEPLLASCLHAWLAAGHTLEEIQDIRVLHGT
ncbi:hypothetical protein [Streptomyces sp. H51]|uniref:hypothetical protein n=1 Tax=Streptomyces sp. H51 TaxID=3111770 RepID=UPI002D778000|nr:hypothetical protein [Streptomyces sp. H51]